MTHTIGLECRGIAPEGFPDDIKRCHRCVDGTAGEFEVPSDWSEVLEKALLEDLESRGVVELTDQMQESINIPECPKGGVRFLTSTVFTKL